MLSLWFLHSISGALAVSLGAFGAHALKKSVQDVKLLDVWDTSCKYHFVHSLLGLMSILYRDSLVKSGQVVNQNNKGLVNNWGGVLALTGNLLFSGSLYGI